MSIIKKRFLYLIGITSVITTTAIADGLPKGLYQETITHVDGRKCPEPGLFRVDNDNGDIYRKWGEQDVLSKLDFNNNQCATFRGIAWSSCKLTTDGMTATVQLPGYSDCNATTTLKKVEIILPSGTYKKTIKDGTCGGDDSDYTVDAWSTVCTTNGVCQPLDMEKNPCMDNLNTKYSECKLTNDKITGIGMTATMTVGGIFHPWCSSSVEFTLKK